MQKYREDSSSRSLETPGAVAPTRGDQTERAGGRRSSDEKLLASARRGDGHAFGELVARHESALFSFALFLVRDYQDAEDLLADAYTIAWRKIPGSDVAVFRTWMYGVLKNLARNFWRKRPDHPPMSLVGQDGSPIDVIDRRQDLRAVDNTLYAREITSALALEQREALYLRFVEDLAFREMGERFGISKQSAEVRTKKALAAARAVGEDIGNFDF